MNSKLNNFLKILFLLFYSVTLIVGECILKYPSNILIKPRLAKKIGSRKMRLPINTDDFNTLHNKEVIIASCDIKFNQPRNYEYIKENTIRCSGKHLYINGVRHSSSIYLECSAMKWNLYEVLQPYIWCPTHMASYALARPNGDEFYTFGNLEGICYDTYNMTVTSVSYKISPRDYKDMSQSAVSFEKIPMMQINYVKDTFKLKSSSSVQYNNEQFENWIKSANYQFECIIQNPMVNNDVYKEYSSLLNFQWWPNLRLNNWRFYEEALAKHIEMESKSYNILAGVSGVLMAPIMESCYKNYTLKSVIDNSNHKIPLYVWNYLYPTAVSDPDPGIVIIGFNSPFAEFYDYADIKFCPDICETADWLENVRATFNYSIMGIVFCCTVEEVRSSNRLGDFPDYLTKPDHAAPCTTKPSATTPSATEPIETTTSETKTTKAGKTGKGTKGTKGGSKAGGDKGKSDKKKTKKKKN